MQEFLQSRLEQDMEAAGFSPQFRLFYALRGVIPAAVRRWSQSVRNSRLTVEDKWYIPPGLEEAIADSNIDGKSIWPNQSEFALVLTHDVEEQDGFNRIFDVADEEEKLGLRSSWSIVPYKYRIDTGVLRELKARGHEIAVHGYKHDGRLFLKKSIFDARLPGINRAVEEFEAKGFRAPMVHRNLEWMQSIQVDYDSSCFDVDPFQAMPGGVGGIWPFQVGNLVELPYTMPQDHTLFITLQERSTQIWKEKLSFIRRNHGMALMLTHPDYLQHNDGIRMYREFLEHACSFGNHWHVLPKEIAQWFRLNYTSKVD